MLLVILKLLKCTNWISQFLPLHVVLVHPLLVVQVVPWKPPPCREKVQGGSVHLDNPLEPQVLVELVTLEFCSDPVPSLTLYFRAFLRNFSLTERRCWVVMLPSLVV